MGDDESGTLAGLRALRREVIDPAIDEHRGRLVKSTGDGLLLEFASAVDAVHFAIAMQDAVGRHQEAAPENRRIVFRVGINSGEVIVEGDDLFGDTVNVAARLEGIAPPGGILLSSAVREQVGRRVPLALDDLGRRTLKNIAEPVHAYAVRVGISARTPAVGEAAGVRTDASSPSDAGPRAGASGRVATRYPAARNLGLAASAAALLLAGVAVWRWSATPPDAPALPVNARTESAAQGKPSIAVLPFENIGGDPEQAYFADGVTEDLITDLSKVSGLFVIAPNSTFAYRGKKYDVREVAKSLGVRFVLEGSVRRSANDIRVNAKLIDTSTGAQVWADRYDGSLANVFALQDKVASSVVGALAVKLTADEQARMVRRGTDNAQAYDVFLKGWGHYQKQTPADFRAAVEFFKQALALDPKYGRAYAALAATYWEAYKRYWGAALGLPRTFEDRAEAERYLAKAMDDPSALAYQVASAIALHARQHDDALAAARKAVALDPNDADSYVALAAALSFAGKPGEGLENVAHAMRLNPHHPSSYFYQQGLAQFSLGRLDQAAGSLERAQALGGEDYWAERLLVATYGLQGRPAEAGKLVAAMHGKDSRRFSYHDPLTVKAISFWYPFALPAEAERFADGLRRAGVPE